MIIQIVRFVNTCFSLELDFKNAGSTNNRTPIMYITGNNLSIGSFNIIMFYNSWIQASFRVWFC